MKYRYQAVRPASSNANRIQQSFPNFEATSCSIPNNVRRTRNSHDSIGISRGMCVFREAARLLESCKAELCSTRPRVDHGQPNTVIHGRVNHASILVDADSCNAFGVESIDAIESGHVQPRRVARMILTLSHPRMWFDLFPFVALDFSPLSCLNTWSAIGAISVLSSSRRLVRFQRRKTDPSGRPTASLRYHHGLSVEQRRDILLHARRSESSEK